MTDDLHSDLEPHDADELSPVAAWLAHNRPVPSAAFRGALRRELMQGRPAASAAPRRLWVAVTSSFGGGVALLAVAALGLVGAGPFAS